VCISNPAKGIETFVFAPFRINNLLSSNGLRIRVPPGSPFRLIGARSTPNSENALGIAIHATIPYDSSSPFHFLANISAEGGRLR